MLSLQERADRQRNQVKEKPMKKLRKLGAAVVLTFVLALSAFTGETYASPCSIPEPGQTDTPPCATQLPSPAVTSTAPGDMSTPAVASETSVTQMAADVLLIFLPLF
jgi:hypothetical protein